MPTTYKDQFFTIDPYNPPPVGTPLTFSRFEMIDENDDGDLDRFDNDSVNGQDITSSWPGDTVTVNVPGVGNVTYVGITFYLADGSQVFTPTDGQVLQNGTFVSSTFVSTQGPLIPSTLGPTCFTRGTMIETETGPRRIETLVEGDLIKTSDHGLQAVRWISCRSFSGRGDDAPIRIAEGALGNTRDLLVSPQHRILLSGWRAELLFGEAEVLVAAKHLTGHDRIHRAECDEVEYFHLLFDAHEIIYSEGIPSESFDPNGDYALADREVRAEVLRIFPEFETPDPAGRQTVRRVLKAVETRVLLG